MRRTTTLAAVVAAAIAASPTLAQFTNPGQPPQVPGQPGQPQQVTPGQPGQQPGQPQAAVRPINDNLFLGAAYASGLMEITVSQIAADRAGSEEVRQFATQMINDHTQANQQIQQLSAMTRAALPTSLGYKEQATLDVLAGLSGAKFDQEYLKQQEAAHMMAIALFQGAAERAQVQQVRDFASQTLGKLQQHLDHARSLQGGGSGSAPGILIDEDAVPATSRAPVPEPGTRPGLPLGELPASEPTAPLPGAEPAAPRFGTEPGAPADPPATPFPGTEPAAPEPGVEPALPGIEPETAPEAPPASGDAPFLPPQPSTVPDPGAEVPPAPGG